MKLKNKIAVIVAMIGFGLLLKFIGDVIIMRTVMIVTTRHIISCIICIPFIAYTIQKDDDRFRWYFLCMFFAGYLMDKVEILFPTLQVTLFIISIPVFIVIEILLISYCAYIIHEVRHSKEIDTL